jgi:hypothetical protein
MFVAIPLVVNRLTFLLAAVMFVVVGLCMVIVVEDSRIGKKRREQFAAARQRYRDRRDEIESEIDEYLDLLKRRPT